MNQQYFYRIQKTIILFVNYKALGLLISFTLIASTAFAQWTDNTAVNTAISLATGNQDFIKAVPDGNGGAIIAWEDTRNGNKDIYAQYISSSGTVLWTAGGVPICTATESQTNISMIADNSGGAIIAWTDFRITGGRSYIQRINASGTVQWTADGVQIHALFGSSPKIVSDGGGGAIVTWSDARSNLDIYVQRINASGVAQWTTNGVAVTGLTSEQRDPVIVSDNSGGGIIVWKDMRNGNEDLYTQRVNSVGVIQWAANGVAITTAADIQAQPSMVTDGAGGAIVAWIDRRNGVDLDIYAQRVNASGTVQWTANGVGICTEAFEQSSLDIASNGSGGAFISWEDRRDGSCCNSDVYAQNISSTGASLWTSNGLAICSHPQGQSSPRIAADGSGGAILSWGDYRGSFDVYAQRVTAAGTFLWKANGTPVSSATGSQGRPQLIVRTIITTAAIFVWEDQRNGNYDVYAQRITCNTVPTTPDPIEGSESVCAGSSSTYTVFPVSGAASYTWTLPAGWTGTSTTNSITITAGAAGGTISVVAENPCGPSTSSSKAVTVNSAPTTPGAITGTPTICSASTNTYSITAVSGATSYTWTLPAGWTGTSTTNTINTTASLTSGSVSVTASNTCGTSTASSKTITVNSAPATPGTITGPDDILVGSANTYSIAAVPGATAYSWTLPGGWTGTSVTTSINTTASTSGGNVSVTASNTCGSSTASAKAVTVNKLTQTITFSDLEPVAVGDPSFNLTATASSGLAVTYSSGNPTVASITGNAVTIHAAGDTEITASQAGNDTFLPAESKSVTLTVELVTGFDEFENSGIAIYPNPGNGLFFIELLPRLSKNNIQVIDVRGLVLDLKLESTGLENVYKSDLSNLASGLYLIRIKGRTQSVKFIKQ